jgi:hypothetical protein
MSPLRFLIHVILIIFIIVLPMRRGWRKGGALFIFLRYKYDILANQIEENPHKTS